MRCSWLAETPFGSVPNTAIKANRLQLIFIVAPLMALVRHTQPSARQKVDTCRYVSHAGVCLVSKLVESGLSAFGRAQRESGRSFRRRGRGLERPPVVETGKAGFGARGRGKPKFVHHRVLGSCAPLQRPFQRSKRLPESGRSALAYRSVDSVTSARRSSASAASSSSGLLQWSVRTDRGRSPDPEPPGEEDRLPR